MKLSKSKNSNTNYLAKIVSITTFHPLIGADRLKCCTIDGYNIITGIDSQPGLYVYFPTSCCINPDFLRYSNLYRHKELNNDPEQSGMFEDNGRVKAIKLKGELSEGFILPIVQFQNYILSVTNKDIEVEEGIEFSNEERFYMEKNSPSCDNKVPHEGIVIKIENMKSEAFKLKTFAFLNGEQKALDKGEENIEDEN